ncbi:MAG: helicase HerA domain-containing protein [Candidatus Hodarchaeales archaeon]
MAQPEFFLGRIGEDRFELPATTFLTHAAVLGASGSGKTVVCKSIVEEAIRAKIPVIAIDPKGDIGALGIGFGGDFSKEKLLIHAKVEAEDRGSGDADSIAEEWIDLYQEKLEESFGEDYVDAEQEYTDTVATVLITPKNSAGIQISLTPNFEKPKNYDKMMEESPDAVLSSLDLKIQLLLSRVGIGTSASTDNRVIYLNNIIRHVWENERKTTVGLDQLIELIQDPPFDKVGSLVVEKFISNPKRQELARRINALMVRAVPGVELDFDKLIQLATDKGKTPIIVFDLRKINDADEKNTFVAEVLGEVQRWAWSKGGTSRLRAIMYFDELYGFMPAGSLSPPSKTALLILLKQARAAGLGCILATQNPGDLDYRGLSNIATWVLGRLATNQDIAKVQGALKPVFEGSGGTEEEFRALMGQIRALKPGNFIAYNPKYGVNRLKTRWLLSLHKGSLVDSEISALTLKPPKPKKSEVKKKTKVKEEIKPPTVTFVSTKAKKPALGKITERFLQIKIKSENNEHINVINDRLSLTGDLAKDGITLKLGDPLKFYSPLYYAKTVIKIKRVLKEGNFSFPIEIKEEMLRTFDIKAIDWNSTTIEGIHASSLPAADLSIQASRGYQFLDFDKEIITKLPENLIWYFTQNPFPEAEFLYHQRLREFERTEVSKLGGKKVSKELSRLSTKISSLEEKLQLENQKLDESISRQENLEAEYKARSAEMRSVKALERSIDSTNSKKMKHEDKIKEFRNQINSNEKKRQILFKEKQSNYEAFHKSIETLKSQGVPPDLYRPEKADISILEKSIYWVPRLMVPLEITTQEDEQKTESYMMNLNLYNGNTELTCEGCGPQISTENYYQSLLAVEISPPTFVCTHCLKLFCSEHITFCQNCGKTSCLDHADICVVCNKALCSSCLVHDENTHEFYCQEHTPKLCQGCGNSFPPETISKCRKCDSDICDSCGRVKVKIKNEEVIARCVLCS